MFLNLVGFCCQCQYIKNNEPFKRILIKEAFKNVSEINFASMFRQWTLFWQWIHCLPSISLQCSLSKLTKALGTLPVSSKGIAFQAYGGDSPWFWLWVLQRSRGQAVHSSLDLQSPVVAALKTEPVTKTPKPIPKLREVCPCSWPIVWAMPWTMNWDEPLFSRFAPITSYSY